MKRICLYAVMLTLFPGWIACERDDFKEGTCTTGSFEYMMIGSFYGECIGNACIQIYKIDMMHVYEDTLDIYPNSQMPYTGSFIQLDDAKFVQVWDILDYMPSALFQEENTVIGMPDAGDWGGKYVEWKTTGSEPRFWLIDNMKSNVPAQYHDFLDQLDVKLLLLQT